VAPFADRMDQPGDAVRLHGNYHECSVPVDYGVIAPDRRWAFHDGIGGDVDRQIVAFDLKEPGNVIPVFFHNTSSVGYDVKPYVNVSPDSTKLLLHSSDMLGDGEAYLAYRSSGRTASKRRRCGERPRGFRSSGLRQALRGNLGLQSLSQHRADGRFRACE
jgi:hypothetical protein